MVQQDAFAVRLPDSQFASEFVLELFAMSRSVDPVRLDGAGFGFLMSVKIKMSMCSAHPGRRDAEGQKGAVAFESAGLPYAPIKAPHELMDDPHLSATHGLAKMELPDGRHVSPPLLPIILDGTRPPVRQGPPKLGSDTDAVLAGIGLSATEIAQARAAGVVG